MAYNLLLFYAFAGLAVVSTLLVIAQSNPIYSVLLLIASFLALAGLYILLDAPFVAVTQIVVYAGAIMVLFLFVVMLLNAPREDRPPNGQAIDSGSTRLIGALLAIALAAELVWAFGRSRAIGVSSAGAEREIAWTVTEIGQLLFKEYAFAFEATSVLILVAMVGAITVAARHAPEKSTSQIVERSPQWPS